MKNLIFTAFLLSQIANAETVSKIIDGDTIKVLEQSNSAQRDKLGLHSIDGFGSQDPQKFRNCVSSDTKQDCNK